MIDHYAAVADYTASEHHDDDGCVKLWTAVFKKTRDDLLWINRYSFRTSLEKHEAKRMARIFEAPPSAFLESAYFRYWCHLLDLDSDAVRKAIER